MYTTVFRNPNRIFDTVPTYFFSEHWTSAYRKDHPLSYIVVFIRFSIQQEVNIHNILARYILDLYSLDLYSLDIYSLVYIFHRVCSVNNNNMLHLIIIFFAILSLPCTKQLSALSPWHGYGISLRSVSKWL